MLKRFFAVRLSVKLMSLAAMALLIGGLALAKQSVLANSPIEVRQKLVTVYDQGVKQVILTDRTTVGEAVKQAGIELAEADRVDPVLTTELSDDKFNINIYRARPVLIIDGANRINAMSPFQIPEQIVRGVGLPIHPEDKIETKINFMSVGEHVGIEYVIKRAKLINFVYYGKTTQVRTQSQTVADFLKEKSLSLGTNDRISVDTTSQIVSDMTLELWREGKQELVQEEEIPFTVRKINDYNREVSYRQVETPGAKGKRMVTYEVEIKNGTEVTRREVNSLLIAAPIEQVEVVGAKGRYNTPGENENITWNFLIEQGFSRVQTAGIMGNLMQEHKFNTDGDGLAQWTGARKAKLKSTYPDSYFTIYSQLEYLMSELNGSYFSTKQAILATNDLREAVRVFQDKFEKCNPKYCMFEQRVRYAADILASH